RDERDQGPDQQPQYHGRHEQIAFEIAPQGLPDGAGPWGLIECHGGPFTGIWHTRWIGAALAAPIRLVKTGVAQSPSAAMQLLIVWSAVLAAAATGAPRTILSKRSWVALS